MSNLLIEEPPLQVLPSLAVALGLNEALILQQMHYWLKVKQQSSDKYTDSFREGRWWVYNSVEQWKAQFPFWSTDTIQRSITSLRKQGVLIVAQLSDDSRDRTNWYTIDYAHMDALAVPVLKVRQSKSAKRGNALPQDAAMGLPQPAAVHDRKMRQCLTETSPKTTQKIHQRVAPAGASEILPSVLPEQKGPEQQEPDQPSLRRRAQGQVFKRVKHAPPCAAVLEQMIQARMGEIQSEDAAEAGAGPMSSGLVSS